MAKQKKTRQEKIIADLRRQLTQTKRKLPTSIISPSISLTAQPQYNMPIKTAFPHSYLLPDLTKTSLVTSIILIGEFVLFFLLKKQILVLPMITF